MAQRQSRNIYNNKKIVKVLLNFLNEADIGCFQNGVRFDSKKINTEVEFLGYGNASNYRITLYLKLLKIFESPVIN